MIVNREFIYEPEYCLYHSKVTIVSSQTPDDLSSSVATGAYFWETHLNVTESLLVGSLICKFNVNYPNEDNLYYSIEAVGHLHTQNIFTINERSGN